MYNSPAIRHKRERESHVAFNSKAFHMLVGQIEKKIVNFIEILLQIFFSIN